MCAILPNPGASSGEAGIWGKDPRGVPKGLSVEQQQLRCQTSLRSRARAATIAPMLTGAGIATNERDLADGERRSGILFQALFRVDICGSQHLDAQCKNIPQGKHVPSQRGSQRRQPQKRTRTDSG